eukprot:768223-Hanusia_phi.AAC.2
MSFIVQLDRRCMSMLQLGAREHAGLASDQARDKVGRSRMEGTHARRKDGGHPLSSFSSAAVRGERFPDTRSTCGVESTSKGLDLFTTSLVQVLS